MKKLLITILLLCPILAYAETIKCKVVGVTDGDSIKCLTAQKEQLKIRLYQIDAPERKQAFGTRSRQALFDLVFNQTVEIETHRKDKYKRTLVTIYKEPIACSHSCTIKIDVNLTMIQLGMAWYYPFAKTNSKYLEAQESAKANKIGLWSQKAIAPWEFRKLKK